MSYVRLKKEDFFAEYIISWSYSTPFFPRVFFLPSFLLILYSVLLFFSPSSVYIRGYGSSLYTFMTAELKLISRRKIHLLCVCRRLCFLSCAESFRSAYIRITWTTCVLVRTNFRHYSPNFTCVNFLFSNKYIQWLRETIYKFPKKSLSRLARRQEQRSIKRESSFNKTIL